MIKKKRFGLIIFLVLFAAIGFAISPALAQDVDGDGNPIIEEQGRDIVPGTAVELLDPGEEAVASDEEAVADGTYGGKTQALWIPSSAFDATNSTTVYNESPIAHRYASSGNGIFTAPVTIPSGVRLTNAQYYIYDNTGYPILCSFYREAFPTGFTTLVAFDGTGGANGYKIWNANLNHTVYNGNYWFQARIDLPTAAGANAKFWGVRLLYYRQIIYPTSQIFSDVPPGGTWSWAYPSIQALSMSGITQGCPDIPNGFCPDKPVSRAAMATFLARALGLHADFSAFGF